MKQLQRKWVEGAEVNNPEKPFCVAGYYDDKQVNYWFGCDSEEQAIEHLTSLAQDCGYQLSPKEAVALSRNETGKFRSLALAAGQAID